jgi:hypothetical protein
MLGAFFFGGDQAAIDMAVELHRKGGNRVYVFRYTHEPESVSEHRLNESDYYFSHAELDSPDLIDPADRVECLGCAEDGEWWNLGRVHQHKSRNADIAAILQEHLI